MDFSQSRSYPVLISHPRVLKNEKSLLDTAPCAWRQTLQDAIDQEILLVSYHGGSETFAKTAHIATNSVFTYFHTFFFLSPGQHQEIEENDKIKFNKTKSLASGFLVFFWYF